MTDDEVEKLMRWLLDNPAYERAPDGSVRLRRDWLSKLVDALTGESNLYVYRCIRFWNAKRLGMHRGTEAEGRLLPRLR